MLAALALAAPAARLAAQEPTQEPYVAAAPGAGRFPLAAAGGVAPIVVGADDEPGVARAARDLAADLGRVTGTPAAVTTGARPAGARTLVIVGTLGHSALLDSLVRARALDAAGLAGKRETFVVQPVERPLPGVDRALVVAGSDRRGTIYGLYDVSAQVGVSPWAWWADVPVRHRPALYVLPGRHTAGEPAVRYRGFFINDEAPAFSGWAREKFGGVDHRVYARVFELLLRLKGNYLWPAMWGNAFADDDSLTAPLAAEYGVVMGTSHHEPMTRAQQEWRRYGRGPWNYEQNDSTLRAFWRAGIARMRGRENVVTIGMRGDGDMPMTEGSNVALLERVVADQRRIIADVTGRPAADTPQLWALYKEVQDYYDRGMRVPDDVTLLFSDDNWGNLRRLPGAGDRARAGGSGVYYHFDYVGGPRNYKWINTNPIARVWEQMRLAYEAGADRIWMVNVGDIKPMEFPLQFFLDYAWNPRAWPASRLPEYARRWAAQQFGPEHAAEIADVVTTTLRYDARRKPELLDTATYSLVNYHEAERVVADWRALEARARALSAALPADARDAYYELVLHPVEAAANLQDLYVTVARNRLYAREGRAATNALADRARALFARDAAISRYYNDSVAGGKWRHMMDQTHIGYTYWQEPPRNVMPRVDVIQVPDAAALGVAWEGQAPPGPRTAAGPLGAPRAPELPEMDGFRRNTRTIDVYDRGAAPLAYRVESGAPWLHVTPAAGTVADERRLTVSVDWDRAPVGRTRVPVTIVGPGGVSGGAPGGGRVAVQAVVRNPAPAERAAAVGFVEGDGYVAIEAEHYARAVAPPGGAWERIPDLGRTLSGITATPVTGPSRTPGGDGPRLEYRMTLADSGEVAVQAYVSPTLNFAGRREGLRYAVSFDGEAPRVVNVLADSSNGAWERGVADNVRVSSTTHTIAHPGVHTLTFWLVDPGVVLQRIVVDAGGVRPSYLGPPESWRAGAGATAAR